MTPTTPQLGQAFIDDLNRLLNLRGASDEAMRALAACARGQEPTFRALNEASAARYIEAFRLFIAAYTPK